MSEKSIFDMAEEFGLTVEHVRLPAREKEFKVYEGVNPVFVGAEDAVCEFLSTFDRNPARVYENGRAVYKD